MFRPTLATTDLRSLAAGFVLLLSLLAVGRADSQNLPTGIQPVPELPRAETAFVLEVDSACCHGPVQLEDASVTVSDGVIRIDTERSCGPLAAVTPYSYSVVVPPLSPGDYRIEVRTQGDCASPDEPELTESVTVQDVSPLAGVRCAPGVEPAATLLFPYFEVDLASTEGVTTLFAVTNTHAEPVLANVVLWSNWALPVASFEVYLSGADVQTINLRDVLAGSLPVTGPGPPAQGESPAFPSCDPSNVAGTGFDADRARAALGGQETAEGCWATRAGENRATGFVTVDVVRECSDLLPGDGGYFEPDATGVAGHANALLGDFFLVEPGESFAQAEPAVHLVADPATLGSGDPTFYTDLAGSGGSDARMPLGRVQGVRFLENPGFDGGTELLVWRDVLEPPEGPLPCASPPVFGPPTPWLRGNAMIEAFDEAENRAFLTASSELGMLFPLATQRMQASKLAPWDSGWLRMELLDQSAVTAVMRGLGRFSVGISSGQLDEPCAAVD